MRSFFEVVRRKIWNIEDALYEKANGFKFGSAVVSDDLVTEYATSLPHASGYRGVRYAKMVKLLKEARKTGINFANFVDVGSGTGKACCIASNHGAFEKIIGIDFSRSLVDKANQNGLVLGDSRVKFLCCDAVDYQLPDQVNLVFLFNPFKEYTLMRFIANNMENFRDKGSVIAYANDVSGDYLEEVGFKILFKRQDLRLALYQLS